MSLTQLLEKFDEWADGLRARKGQELYNPEAPIKYLRSLLEQAYQQGVEEGNMKGQKEEAEKWIYAIKKNIQINNP